MRALTERTTTILGFLGGVPKEASPCSPGRRNVLFVAGPGIFEALFVGERDIFVAPASSRHPSSALGGPALCRPKPYGHIGEIILIDVNFI